MSLSIARLAAFADPTADEYRIGVARELLATDHASFALRELQTIESGSPFASAATDVRIAAVLATGDEDRALSMAQSAAAASDADTRDFVRVRSEEHTSELQSPMRTTYH